MNEERYILARFIQNLQREDAKSRAKDGWGERWNLEELCAIIEGIRAEAVLGDSFNFEEVE